VLVYRGQLADAAALRDAFLPRARESSDPQVLTPALATSAVIELSRGASAAAVSLIAELEAATRDRPVRRAQHLPDAVRVCAAAGAMDLAETLLERTDVSAVRQANAVHAARAIFAEAEGQRELALRFYEESADRWATYGFVLEQGHALLGAGRCLLALEHAQRAATSLRNAQAIFESLGARPLVADTRQLLEQAASLAP
jgi:tetratricopeptide (TPR) repeat protein